VRVGETIQSAIAYSRSPLTLPLFVCLCVLVFSFVLLIVRFFALLRLQFDSFASFAFRPLAFFMAFSSHLCSCCCSLYTHAHIRTYIHTIHTHIYKYVCKCNCLRISCGFIVACFVLSVCCFSP